MHHKRGKASNQRAGCKLCKPWKVNGFATEREGGEKHSDHVKREFSDAEIREQHEKMPDIMNTVMELFKEGLQRGMDLHDLSKPYPGEVKC